MAKDPICRSIHDAVGRERARTYMVDTQPDDAVVIRTLESARLERAQEQARRDSRCSVCGTYVRNRSELDDSARCASCAP